MKELINDLVSRSGLDNKGFALRVGTSASYLSQQKQQKNINYQLLIKWAKMFDIGSIESCTKECTIKIEIR
jgi:hypothetical protein